MSIFAVKLPDVGEGVAEAELIAWHVSVGDRVTPESILAEVMTDKATVEISSPLAGVVTFLHGQPGDVLAVGGEFVGIEIDGAATQPDEATAAPPAGVADAGVPAAIPEQAGDADLSPPNLSSPNLSPANAAPAVRARARALGIELSAVTGSGPEGRVLHADLDRHLVGVSPGTVAAEVPRTEVVRGLRRRIAERLTASWSEIPHITYVEAVDATDLEALRAELNRRGHPSGARLTILPFLVRAMVIACAEQPRLNAHYDSAAGTLSVFDAVHVGIATQTPDGLIVPVVHHAEARGLWALAGEIGRVAAAARDGKGTLADLTGSTITITSLGALGGLMTTPLINQPEVAIVGVNKLETRPVWGTGTFEPRQMFNLSSSFDHRIVDGWDAATFIQRVKALLEMPALLFVTDEG
jgi:2-oxoisovalerate dehydrogenase E2 component (dihydrolipoyl transacylase)